MVEFRRWKTHDSIYLLLVRLPEHRIYAYTKDPKCDYWFSLGYPSHIWQTASEVQDVSRLTEREQLALYRVALLGEIW